MSHRGKVSLLVRNLAHSTSDVDLRKIFERFGEIRDVYLPKDYYTRRVHPSLPPSYKKWTGARF